VGDWIYPFRGREASGAVNQRFLWKHDCIYVMDNHRAALWCWLQHLKPDGKYGVFHIDAHYDASPISDERIAALPDLSKISFQDYLSIPSGDGDVPLIRWDNYLYLFEKTHHSQIGAFFLSTHGDGEKPVFTTHCEEIQTRKLGGQLRELLDDFGNDGWILNIDLDYFFARLPANFTRLHSNQYIAEFFQSVGHALISGRVTCLTICLSPECSGGWQMAEELCYELCNAMGIDFRLPERA
jgi:hypothetical protein